MNNYWIVTYIRKLLLLSNSDNGIGVILFFVRVLFKDTYRSIYRLNAIVSGLCYKIAWYRGGKMNWGRIKTIFKKKDGRDKLR